MFCDVAKRLNIAWYANSKCLTDDAWTFGPWLGQGLNWTHENKKYIVYLIDKMFYMVRLLKSISRA